MSQHLSDLLLKYNPNSTMRSKIGSTTTVNEQFDQLDANLTQFKRFYDLQSKQQFQLQFQLKKLEESTKINFMEMNKQFSDRIEYLTQLFKQQNQTQVSQFQYLQAQNKILHSQHDTMHDMSVSASARAQNMQNAIGI